MNNSYASIKFTPAVPRLNWLPILFAPGCALVGGLLGGAWGALAGLACWAVVIVLATLMTAHRRSKTLAESFHALTEARHAAKHGARSSAGRDARK